MEEIHGGWINPPRFQGLFRVPFPGFPGSMGKVSKLTKWLGVRWKSQSPTLQDAQDVSSVSKLKNLTASSYWKNAPQKRYV